MEPFSEVLDFANARAVVAGGWVIGGNWALRFPAPTLVKFLSVVRGSFWLQQEGGAAVHLAQGDIVLYAAPRPLVAASDLRLTPRDALTVFRGMTGGIAQAGGDDVMVVGGHIALDPGARALFDEVLPDVVHVPGGDRNAPMLAWILEHLRLESSAKTPGSEAAMRRLADLLLIQTLRTHLADASDAVRGSLRAAVDPRLAPVVRMMHENPARPWQLSELAKAAAMSRTTFIEHFKQVAGVPPLTYLSQWRMRLAQRALRDEHTTVTELASALGYASESAFSSAFKRFTGMAPRSYRKALGAATATHDTSTR